MKAQVLRIYCQRRAVRGEDLDGPASCIKTASSAQSAGYQCNGAAQRYVLRGAQVLRPMSINAGATALVRVVGGARSPAHGTNSRAHGIQTASQDVDERARNSGSCPVEIARC